VRDGLYKVDYHTVHGTGNGVVYAAGGKIRGGNSAFAFIGNYNCNGETISAKVSTLRHNDDPSFKPLFGIDMITLTLKGTACGDILDFEGFALQSPGISFKAVLTLIND
jgi:T3SS negative regulator,GrlR